jgi:hypothetical protein
MDYRNGFVDGALYVATVIIAMLAVSWLLEPPRTVHRVFVPVLKPEDLAPPADEKAE